MEALWNKKVRAEECPGGGGKVGWYAPECDVEKRWFSRKRIDLFFAPFSLDGRYLEIVIVILKLGFFLGGMKGCLNEGEGNLVGLSGRDQGAGSCFNNGRECSN